MRVIDRKKAIEAIMDLENCPNGLSDTYDKARIIAELEEVPAIDAVEVVRCKDCAIRFDSCPMVVRFGRLIQLFTEDEDFCSRGRREP